MAVVVVQVGVQMMMLLCKREQLMCIWWFRSQGQKFFLAASSRGTGRGTSRGLDRTIGTRHRLHWYAGLVLG